MHVSRAKISGSKLSRCGARWVTTTKAMPGSVGMALNRCSSASTPPAEAPTPTMGKGVSIGSPLWGKRNVYAWVAPLRYANDRQIQSELLWVREATHGLFGARQKLS